MSLSLLFSLGVLIASAGLCAIVARGWSRLRPLREVPPILPANAPPVSIVVAARDEALAIEPAVRSILAMDYPSLEIVVVDDRSTDGTGEILDRLRDAFPQLRVVHIDTLPAGWLGKNHALHRGAEGARGEYLLFTDADVMFEATALGRAIAYCEEHRLDHLTVVPELIARSGFLALNLMGGFVGIFLLHRPWRANESSRHDIGVGAFNLVRASTHAECGGHQAIAMEVLDDIELGRLMGERGKRQGVLLGQGMVSLEMYGSSLELFRGIQKNVFTFLDYSAARLVAATVVTLVFSVWPWVGPFVTEGAARWLSAASAACWLLLHARLAPEFGYPRRVIAFLPLTGVVTIALMWQIAIRTWIQGGIVWRGTLYPLAELRRHRARRKGA